MINVLVFPCGSEIGLEVNEALKRDKHIKLFGLSSVPCHGRFVYENYIEGISFINSDSFIDELNRIIEDNNIDLLIPAYDDAILYLSEARDEIKCKLVTSSKETCRIARSKVRTYEKLKGYDFTPEVYSINEIEEQDLPLFAKPDIGQGSSGVFRVESLHDLEIIKESGQEYVICELLEGEEFTIDCFTDSKGEIINMSMRSRTRTRNGISVNSRSVPIPQEVKKIAEAINKEIIFDGVWFFQVKQDKTGKYKLLEVAPRVAGTMSLSRVRGFNFILNSVYQAMGYTVKGLPWQAEYVEEDRALSNNFNIALDYDTVYVDLDDTLILVDKVNTEMIAFLYQCANRGIKIIMISRHARDERDTLKRFHIDEALFKEIIHVKEDELKSSYIKESKAIFIDDAFRERLDVASVNNIPVFDIDCIPALMN